MPPAKGPRPHIQTLSDMVFGLALSLGALVLVNQPLRQPTDLYYGLGMFAFSFLLLVTVWYSYSIVMSVLPMETRNLLFLNLVLLFVVAVEPYLLYVLAYHAAEPVGEPASVLYALDLAGMTAILGGFTHVLAREDRPLVPVALFQKMRARRNVDFAISGLFLVSILPFFWTWMWLPSFPGRIGLWLISFPVRWATRPWTR